MKNLGNSVLRYKNMVASFGFWVSVLITVFFVGFFIAVTFFNIVEDVDETSNSILLLVMPLSACLTAYMYFKSKTEIDIRDHGLFIKNMSKEHEIFYDEIAQFDKTKRVCKSESTIFLSSCDCKKRW